MRIVFVDADDALGDLAERIFSDAKLDLVIVRSPNVRPEELPALLAETTVVMIDHTAFPLEIAAQCPSLRDVIFLGTGARSYMDPDALAALGISVHIISGYGDTAVAEMTVALMWAATRSLTWMDREMRDGRWQRTHGEQFLAGQLVSLASGVLREK